MFPLTVDLSLPEGKLRLTKQAFRVCSCNRFSPENILRNLRWIRVKNVNCKSPKKMLFIWGRPCVSVFRISGWMAIHSGASLTAHQYKSNMERYRDYQCANMPYKKCSNCIKVQVTWDPCRRLVALGYVRTTSFGTFFGTFLAPKSPKKAYKTPALTLLKKMPACAYGAYFLRVSFKSMSCHFY